MKFLKFARALEEREESPSPKPVAVPNNRAVLSYWEFLASNSVAYKQVAFAVCTNYCECYPKYIKCGGNV